MERTFAEFRRSAKIKHGTFNGTEKRIRTNWKYTASHYVRGIEMIAKFVCLKAWTCWKRIKFQNHKVFLSTLRFVHFGLIFFAAYRYFYSFSFSPSFFLRTSITKVRPSWVSFFLHLRISIALFFFSCRPTHSSSFKQNGWFVSLLFARKISKSK